MNIDIINEMHTQNVMILNKNDNGSKRFEPQTIMNLINFAQSIDWKHDSSKIDLQLLTYENKSELTAKYDFEKEIVTIPCEYIQNTESVEWELFSIRLTYSDDETIFLPGHYEVIKVDPNSGKRKYVQIKDIRVNDLILCNFFNNVIISQSVFEISSSGVYNVHDTINFNVEGEYFIPIGNHVFQVYCK